MRILLIICILLVVVLNSLLMVPSLHEHAMPLGAAAIALAILSLIFVALSGKEQAARGSQAVTPPPAPAGNQAEAEVVAFFGLLQEKGRFVDFLMEDITPFNDSQVAAASRVVHQGCQAVLKEHFQIQSVADTTEGSQVTVPVGYAADEYRLLGKVRGEAPFTGTLIHKGWKTEMVKLPRLLKADDSRLPAIAPAEVELT